MRRTRPPPGPPGMLSANESYRTAWNAPPAPHDEPGDDLDDADGVHRPGCAQRREVQQGRSEVLVPMGEEVEELVQPGNDRRRHEGQVQQTVRLISRGSGSLVAAVARYV